VSASVPARIAFSQGGAGSTVWIGSDLLEAAGEYLSAPSGRFLLYSSAAAQDAAAVVRRSLGSRVLVDHVLADRETEKTLETAAELAGRALEAGVRRDDAIVALGGGVTTDLVGFVSAILLRGVAWNAVPTTTAGMADAAIGGKTGVNHGLGKNLLGAFHPPVVILVDPAAAATLPDRDYRAGLVEAYKAAWVADARLAEHAARELPAILARDRAELTALLAGAIRVKVSLVASDPRDAGNRRLLNFGHTLGHALEAAGGFERLRHGEAVAWGIAAAVEISLRRAGLSDKDARQIRDTLARLGPFPAPERDRSRLEPLLARDKKSTSRGLTSVLIPSIGAGRLDESVSVGEWLDAAAIMSLS
jgi:3-dehydroquinate synthase